MHDELKRRWDFAAWQGINRLQTHLLLWHFRLRGAEVPGWQLKAARALPLALQARFLPSMWQSMGGRRDEALRIDAYECASRSAAHEMLLRLLGEFTTPFLQRLTDRVVGDVCFGGTDERSLLFARANIVVLLANAGHARVPVTPCAEALDQDVVATPPIAARTAAGPMVAAAVRAHRVAVGDSWPLDIEELAVPAKAGALAAATTGAHPGATAAADEPTSKCFSTGCELFVADGVVRAAPLHPGRHAVKIYTQQTGSNWRQHEVAIEGVAP